jgi:hypothetical protein
MSAVCLAHDGWSGLRDTVFVSAPKTVYTKSGAVRIAYQVVGAGPPDILATKPPFFPVDLM